MSNIEYLKIPNSDLTASKICFGGEQLGGFGLGEYNIAETIRTAHEAREKGINFFDTADCYNLGESEKNLSQIIQSRRDQVIVSSKFGVRLNPFSATKRVFYDNSVNWIDEALKGSLGRLKTDYIDLYQMHHWDKTTALEKIFKHLEKKCDQGLIRYYGVSNIESPYKYTDDYPRLISFSNEYSLANRIKEEDIRLGVDNGMCFLGFGALGQGILTGKYNLNSTFEEGDRRSNPKYFNFHGEKMKNNVKIVDALKEISEQKLGSTPAQLAIKWVLSHINNTIVIAGIKNSKQLDDNLSVFKLKFSKEDERILNKLSQSKH